MNDFYVNPDKIQDESIDKSKLKSLVYEVPVTATMENGAITEMSTEVSSVDVFGAYQKGYSVQYNIVVQSNSGGGIPANIFYCAPCDTETSLGKGVPSTITIIIQGIKWVHRGKSVTQSVYTISSLSTTDLSTATATINGGTITSTTLSKPTISDGTITNSTLTGCTIDGVLSSKYPTYGFSSLIKGNADSEVVSNVTAMDSYADATISLSEGDNTIKADNQAFYHIRISNLSEADKAYNIMFSFNDISNCHSLMVYLDVIKLENVYTSNTYNIDTDTLTLGGASTGYLPTLTFQYDVDGTTTDIAWGSKYSLVHGSAWLLIFTFTNFGIKGNAVPLNSEAKSTMTASITETGYLSSTDYNNFLQAASSVASLVEQNPTTDEALDVGTSSDTAETESVYGALKAASLI